MFLKSRADIITRGRRFGLTAFAAVLFLFLQVAAAAHFHSFQSSRSEAGGPVAASTEVCAVCAFAFHTPVIASPVPLFSAAAAEASIFVAILAEVPSAAAFDSRSVRAPPASL